MRPLHAALIVPLAAVALAVSGVAVAGALHDDPAALSHIDTAIAELNAAKADLTAPPPTVTETAPAVTTTATVTAPPVTTTVTATATVTATTTATATTPTATPTTTTPPPPAGSNGWDLTAANTGLAGAGVNRASLPVYTGTFVSGQTYSLVKITHNVTLPANVTLDRVWIAPTGGGDALLLGNGATVKNSDITGSGTTTVGIRGYDPTGYSIRGSYVEKVQIGAWIDGTGTGSITGSYLNANATSAGGHVDGLTRRGGTGALTVTGSRINANVNGSTTGAFFLQNTDGGAISGITLKDTLLEGIGYLFTLENRGPGTSVSASHVRARLSTPNYYGYVTTVGTISTPTWTDVRVYDAAQPDAAGAAIAKP